MADKKQISSKKNALTKEQLAGYLQENLPEEKRLQMEKIPEGEHFLTDAMEGLQAFDSTEKINKSISKINNSLHRTLQNNTRKKAFKFDQIIWYVIAVIVVIMLILFAFAVLRLKN